MYFNGKMHETRKLSIGFLLEIFGLTGTVCLRHTWSVSIECKNVRIQEDFPLKMSISIMNLNDGIETCFMFICLNEKFLLS